jgi:hypothetical protein
MCLIAMNQPKTSYCRVTFYRSFFEGAYRVGNHLPDPRNGKEMDGEVGGTESGDIEELPFLRTQISVKVLVSTRLIHSETERWMRLLWLQ